ncbi:MULTISPECIES: DUF2171 domain-containing protein [Deinococcus]|uniref:DUF2171 domain-containing protein n=1 Tax=Deinococcus TaxID=1298 RepID=UPI001E3A46C9|nr:MULTISPECIES: DUF2171 domain-containing protein [Deinococcus]
MDHLDGEYIKLTKDDSGQHHWLPLSAVDHVYEHFHLNWSHAQVHQQWLSEDPRVLSPHPEPRQ